jgi:hypothetical protein
MERSGAGDVKGKNRTELMNHNEKKIDIILTMSRKIYYIVVFIMG